MCHMYIISTKHLNIVTAIAYGFCIYKQERSLSMESTDMKRGSTAAPRTQDMTNHWLYRLMVFFRGSNTLPNIQFDLPAFDFVLIVSEGQPLLMNLMLLESSE